MHRLSLHSTIAPVAPYRLDLTEQALRRVSSNVVDVLKADGTYPRAFSGADGVNIIEVQQQTDGALDVRITGRGARARVETVATMLGTEVSDLHSWYRRAARTPLATSNMGTSRREAFPVSGLLGGALQWHSVPAA